MLILHYYCRTICPTFCPKTSDIGVKTSDMSGCPTVFQKHWRGGDGKWKNRGGGGGAGPKLFAPPLPEQSNNEFPPPLSKGGNLLHPPPPSSMATTSKPLCKNYPRTFSAPVSPPPPPQTFSVPNCRRFKTSLAPPPPPSRFVDPPPHN